MAPNVESTRIENLAGMSKTVVMGSFVMGSLDLERELDRLYGTELGAFVAERTGLVRALRKEGASCGGCECAGTE